MPVYLDSYNVIRAPKQGAELWRLIHAKPQALTETFPDLADRYRNPLRAVKNVGRIAGSREVHPYIIRADKQSRALGVATIIIDQTVVHPTGGAVAGNDLDYWVKDRSPDLHAEIATRILSESEQLALRYHGEMAVMGSIVPCKEAPNPFFFTVIGDKPHTAPGLMTLPHIEQVGEIASITTEGPDTYGIARDGAPVELYRGYTLATL